MVTVDPIEVGDEYEFGDGDVVEVTGIWVDEDCDAQISMSDGRLVTPEDIHGLIEDGRLFEVYAP